MALDVTVRVDPPWQTDVAALIDALDAYQQTLYPPESLHALDCAALSADDVVFAVARDALNTAVGCAALRVGDGYAEIKRMFVRAGVRRGGVGTALLGFLETEAAERGFDRMLLETGVHQPQAIALYSSHGYVCCGRFADYPDDPLSVFMQKHLDG